MWRGVPSLQKGEEVPRAKHTAWLLRTNVLVYGWAKALWHVAERDGSPMSARACDSSGCGPVTPRKSVHERVENAAHPACWVCTGTLSGCPDVSCGETKAALAELRWSIDTSLIALSYGVPDVILLQWQARMKRISACHYFKPLKGTMKRIHYEYK